MERMAWTKDSGREIRRKNQSHEGLFRILILERTLVYGWKETEPPISLIAGFKRSLASGDHTVAN